MKYRLLCILTLVTITACQSEKESAASEAPNILFIFADDQTYTAVNAMGNSAIKTPNIDRLMNEGTTFTNAYNMGGWNGAVCVASRSMIISGRYIWQARQMVEPWRAGDSTAMNQTWGQLMNQKGYDTYMTGKWHVAAPADQVFQQARHVRPGMPRDANFFQALKNWRESGDESKSWDEIMPPGYNRPLSEDDESWSPTDPEFGGFWEGGKHWSEVVKDDALDFLNTAQQSDRPFFMYVAFNAPHDPRQAPQNFVDMYPVEDMEVPASFLPLYPYRDSMGCSRYLRDEALAPFPRTEYAVKVHQREYYAIVSHLDQQIGLILDALEASGKRENTYVFFTADHGLSVGRHGLLGKQNMYDHSVRVPLAMAGPGIPAGKKVEADVYLQDIMATSLELAEIPKPTYVNFHSLLPLALGETTEGPYPEIYGCYVDSQRMIRKDGYKLIVYPKIGKVRLYHVAEDPEEMRDLAGDEAQRERVKGLLQDLRQLQEKMGDELEIDLAALDI